MNTENINFKASQYAPNHLEVTYWIDLTEDPTGGVIKTYDGKKWNQIKGEAQSIDAYTKSETDGKYATITNLNAKANSADVYTRTQVYTKEECEAKITEMIEAAMAPAA